MTRMMELVPNKNEKQIRFAAAKAGAYTANVRFMNDTSMDEKICGKNSTVKKALLIPRTKFPQSILRLIDECEWNVAYVCMHAFFALPMHLYF